MISCRLLSTLTPFVQINRSIMVKAKVYKFRKQFDGFPKATDLELVEEELPPIKDNEFLAEAVYLSVDPYMRPYSRNLPLGSDFLGSQVAKIIESKNAKFPVGQHVVGHFGWRTHTISDGSLQSMAPPHILPDFKGLPLSLGIGLLGMPGLTSYFGFLEICQPKAGETVVVTGAAGAVGSAVGQIAKIKGCKVIGIAGSDEKGEWLIKELGFDHFINYKTANIDEELKKAAPNGVDCYFDNVGGEISHTVLTNMNLFGRISVCGAISGYNEKRPTAPIVQFPMVFKQLKMEGFLVTRWYDRSNEGIQQLAQWIKEGKLKYHETVTEGFENMFQAFLDMLKGGNVGKAVVKV